MKTTIAMTIAAAAALLAGCAGLKMPQNAEEYRTRMPEKYTDKYEVKRPYKTVSDTLKRKSAECFDVAVTRQYVERNGPYTFNKVKTVRFRPAVSVSAKQTVLQLQSTEAGESGGMQKIPQGGMYILVADAFPAGSDKTRLEIYGANLPFGTNKVFSMTVKDWANGQNLTGCPALK
jgi:hypothetical protein